jgi:hypothetical protein
VVVFVTKTNLMAARKGTDQTNLTGNK